MFGIACECETGFEVVDKGCYGVGKNNGQITYLSIQNHCVDRRKYLYWDAIHPTEVENIVFANISCSSTSKANVLSTHNNHFPHISFSLLFTRVVCVMGRVLFITLKNPQVLCGVPFHSKVNESPKNEISR